MEVCTLVGAMVTVAAFNCLDLLLNTFHKSDGEPIYWVLLSAGSLVCESLVGLFFVHWGGIDSHD
jgi:hypothetical protein